MVLTMAINYSIEFEDTDSIHFELIKIIHVGRR